MAALATRVHCPGEIVEVEVDFPNEGLSAREFTEDKYFPCEDFPIEDDQQSAASPASPGSFDTGCQETNMDATAMTPVDPAEEEADDGSACSLSQFSFSVSRPGSCDDTNYYTEMSSFSVGSFSSTAAPSGSFDDGCSIDSIGNMLIQLEDNDATLSELTIDCKAMDKEGAVEVGLILPRNTRVKKLTLRCGSLPEHQEILERVTSALKDNRSIEHVELRDARIDREAAVWLAPPFAQNRALQHVTLVNCKGSGLEEVFVAMQHNKFIQHLTIRSCRWKSYIYDIMASSLPSMNLISLSLNDIRMKEDGWPFLFKNIGNCRELTRLDLSKNRLSEANVFLLARSLTVQRQVTTLRLSSCRLRNGCLRELALGLRDHYALASIDLSRNSKLSDKGVIFLKDLLLRTNSIVDVCVDGCGLSDKSLDIIEIGLRYNRSIAKSFCSFAVFDVFDSIVACAENMHVTEARDAIETHNDGFAKGERRSSD